VSEKALIALSGGVDSAVAAALLIEKGFEVIGVTLQLWKGWGEADDAAPFGFGAAFESAQLVARHLGIPFIVLDAEQQFKNQVVDYFIREYAAGRTPNPCVRCNQALKFGLLLQYAALSQVPLVATGHYARVHSSAQGYRLLRGIDPRKDQSYFLYTLTQEQLSHVAFPIGNLTKEETRAMARKRGLPVSDRPASQDVCFIPDGDYRRFLARYAPDLCKPGPIYDTSGQLLGQHQGYCAYTVGQRKGLRISAPEPLYVLGLDPARNAVIVGPAGELGSNECHIEDVHYVNHRPSTRPFRSLAQIRYRAIPTPVTVSVDRDRTTHLRFHKTQRDIAPGQSVVLYDGDEVIGGGVICNVSDPCYNNKRRVR